jgi:polar amino acid transport system permease protein
MFVMSAYSAEVFRSGIESIPRGQFEAAQALGLSFILTLRKVILPQAVKLVIPPTTSNCVSMFKDTSLASAVALPELLKEANDAQALYANPSPLIAAALIYLAFLWPMVRVVGYLEKRSQASTMR